MGVRVVFPDMGKDPSVQLIEKTITQNGTYDAITDGANGYSKVNVNVEGGGGSSDFSTAEVTIINNSGGEYYFSLMTEYDGTDYYISALFNNGGHYYGAKEFDMNDGETATFEFIALEPSFKISTNESAEATGDCVIEFNDNSGSYEAIITGDCTITINPAS